MLYNKLASRCVLTARGIFIDMNILIEIMDKIIYIIFVY